MSPQVGDHDVIRFQCPGCRTVLGVGAELAGAAVACSQCKKRLRVPPPPSPKVVTSPQSPEARRVPERRAEQPAESRVGLGLVVGAVVILFAVVGLGVATAAWALSRSRPVVSEPIADEGRTDRPAPDEAVQVAPKKDVPVGEKPAPKATDPPDGEELLSAINVRRKEAGAAGLTIHGESSIGCLDHARYLLRNLAAHPTLDPHDEIDLPGATPAGKSASAYVSVAHLPPKDALAAWLAAPAHRQLLLDPARKSVGIGFANEGERWITVLDAVRGAAAPGADPAGGVLYPAPGQSGVPLAFPGNEVPDPLPEAKVKLAGFPVTVTFPARLKVTGAKAVLEDESGRSVSVWFSSPEKPANEAHARLQQNTLCLFARDPLSAGTRYVVSMEAEANGKPWRRAWSFTTVGAGESARMYRRALARLNDLRKAAGLDEVQVDEERAKGCVAHARYLARHIDHTPGVRVNEQKADLPGATPEGQAVARLALVRLGGGAGPADAVDWMFDSVLNRHLALNPAQKKVAFGAAQHFPRGWVWVVGVESRMARTKGEPAVLYPGADMKGVPRYFGRAVGEVVAGQPKGHAAGFAVTANFFLNAKIARAKGELLDADGNAVAAWLSTPEKPLPGTGAYKQILLIPKGPLAPNATYSVSMSCEADGQPWSRRWRFTTADEKSDESNTATRLLGAVNEARRWAGLDEVALDEGLSRGCKAHARYVARNLDHPKVQGLGIHEEDPELPGATPAGAKAGNAAVIAVLSEPGDSVDGWVATLYHRIPLLDPSLKRIGYGHERHPFRGWVTVMDAISGRK